MDRAVRVTSLLVASYVAAQMLADISSLKITEVAGLSMDAGTLIYPFTFTIRDLIHRMAGASVARLVIIAAAVVNLLMALLFWVVDQLPVAADVGPQTELFGQVLAPVWRIVFASIVAEVVAELVDTATYSRWAARFGQRMLWGRVLVSNAVAIPLDTAIFVTIAFGGVVAAGDMLELMTTNVAVKGAVTLVSIPWIYLVRPEATRGRRPV